MCDTDCVPELSSMPDDVLSAICANMESKCLLQMSLTNHDISEIAMSQYSSLKEKWTAFIAKCGKPVRILDMKGERLDTILFEFITNDGNTKLITGLPPNGIKLDKKMRAWLHARCDQFGLESRTENRQRYDDLADVCLAKPINWKMNWDNPNAIKYKSYGRLCMEDWKAICYNCGVDLNAWTAFYHYSGMGPLCYECIENNEEYRGLKWEPRADF